MFNLCGGGRPYCSGRGGDYHLAHDAHFERQQLIHEGFPPSFPEHRHTFPAQAAGGRSNNQRLDVLRTHKANEVVSGIKTREE